MDMRSARSRFPTTMLMLSKKPEKIYEFSHRHDAKDYLLRSLLARGSNKSPPRRILQTSLAQKGRPNDRLSAHKSTQINVSGVESVATRAARQKNLSHAATVL